MRLRTVLPAVAVTLLPAAAAQADDARRGGEADTAETLRIEDTIVVRATGFVPEGNLAANKTDIPLIRTPQSVSVVTRDQIDLLNFIDLQQASRYTAGIASESFGPDLRFDFLRSRGFLPRQYVNGVVAPSSTTIAATGVDLYAFESVQFLKGPASTLYGSAPPGGLYNQTTRRPEGELRGEVRARVGTDDFSEIAGTVTDGLADGVSARLTALYRDRQSYRDLVDAQRLLVAPAARFELSARTTLDVDAIYQDDEVNGEFNGFLPVQGILSPNPNGEIPIDVNIGDPANRFEREQYAVGGLLRHALTDGLSFVSNVRYADYQERTPQNVYAGGGFTNTDDPGAPGFFDTLGRFDFTYAEDVTALSADTRLDAAFDAGGAAHQLIVGLDYRDVENTADFGFFFDVAPIDLFAPVYTPVPERQDLYPTAFNDQTLEQVGLYAQDQVRVGDLFVTLGVRHDWVEIDDALADTVRNQEATTYRVGANYVLPGGLAPYVSYSTSFEPLLGTDQQTGERFDPSEGEQFEAGVKYDGRDLSRDIDLFASAAVFWIEQSNVVTVGAGTTPVFGTQSGEVEVAGFEAELVTRIDDRFSLNAAYSYTDSEVTRNETVPEQVGARLPATPEHKLAFFAAYNVQEGPLAGLGYGAGMRFLSDSAGSLPGPFNPVVIDGDDSVLFDAILSYDTPGWRFAVNGSNVLDTRYGAICASPTGCNFGAPREVIGTVQYKF